MKAPPQRSTRTLSLRRYLLIGILLPIGVLVVFNTFSLYHQALNAVNTAYDPAGLGQVDQRAARRHRVRRRL